MENKFEYNLGPNEIPKNTLPEKIHPDKNEYLLPMNSGVWELIIEALEVYTERTSVEEIKNQIREFFNSIEKLDTENLLGKISGYYLVTDYKNYKWKESKKIRLEIKIQKEGK